MRKLAGLLLSWVCSVHALEIPADEEVTILSLRNGVQLWMKQHATPGHSISCRIIARNPHEEIPQIFPQNFPAEIFEDELPCFIDYCRESIHKQAQCDMAVVVVGDFDQDGLRKFLAQAFDVFPQRQSMSPLPLVSVTRSEQPDILYLSLYYPTALQELKTDQDLKQLWILYLLQSMCQERFHKAMNEVGGEWIPPPETKHFLPCNYTATHGRQRLNKEEPVNMLFACLYAMQELKSGKGFTEAELFNAKAKLQKNLMTFYQQNPDNNTLADYYTSHFVFGMGCPNYDVFMATSLGLVSDVNMQDMADFVGTYFKDETRRVEMKVPKDSSITEAVVKEALGSCTADALVFNFEPCNDQVVLLDGTDPYAQLPITELEAQLIYEILDTMANNNVAALLFKKSEMEKKGRKINPVHPMRFLGTVFSNPYLKKCMAEIMDSYFKWNGFISGISQRLEEEHKRGNLLPYVPGLCQAIKANPDQVRFFIQKKEWENLVIYLIKLT